MSVQANNPAPATSPDEKEAQPKAKTGVRKKAVSKISLGKVLMAAKIIESQFTTIDIVKDMYVESFQDSSEPAWEMIGLASWIGLAQSKVAIEVSAFSAARVFMRTFGFVDRHGKYRILMPSSKKDEDVLLKLMDSIIPLFHAYSLFNEKVSGMYEDETEGASGVMGQEVTGSKKDNDEATDSTATQQAQKILLDIQEIMTLQVSMDFVSALGELTMSVLEKIEGRKIHYSLLQRYFHNHSVLLIFRTMINLPFFKDDWLGQKAVLMMIGVIVDNDDKCVHFGSSWNVIPFDNTYTKQEREIRKRAVGDYYEYEDFFNAYLQVGLKEESENLKSIVGGFYTSEFDSTLANKLLEVRTQILQSAQEKIKFTYDRLFARWCVWRAPYSFHATAPDHLEFMCRGFETLFSFSNGFSCRVKLPWNHMPTLGTPLAPAADFRKFPTGNCGESVAAGKYLQF